MSDPYQHAKTCSTTSTLLAIALVIAGSVISNVGHARFEDIGIDWAGIGVWAAAAGVCVAVGQSAAAICRQLADALTPPN